MSLKRDVNDGIIILPGLEHVLVLILVIPMLQWPLTVRLFQFA